MASSIFMKNTNYFTLHGNYIFKKVSDMAMAKMCAYKISTYALTHRKCVVCLFAKFTCVDLTIS